MRKRTIKYAADTIFWYVLYLAPLIAYFIYLLSFLKNPNLVIDENMNIAQLLKFSTFVSRVDISVYSSTNFIYTTFASIFGNGGIFPIFSVGSFVHFMMTYFVCVYCVHLVVDFVLFIPKLAMKWMNYFTNTED